MSFINNTKMTSQVDAAVILKDGVTPQPPVTSGLPGYDFFSTPFELRNLTNGNYIHVDYPGVPATGNSLYDCAEKCNQGSDCAGFNFRSSVGACTFLPTGAASSTLNQATPYAKDEWVKRFDSSNKGMAYRKKPEIPVNVNDTIPAYVNLSGTGRFCRDSLACNTVISNALTIGTLTQFDTADFEACYACPSRKYRTTEIPGQTIQAAELEVGTSTFPFTTVPTVTSPPNYTMSMDINIAQVGASWRAILGSTDGSDWSGIRPATNTRRPVIGIHGNDSHSPPANRLFVNHTNANGDFQGQNTNFVATPGSWFNLTFTINSTSKLGIIYINGVYDSQFSASDFAWSNPANWTWNNSTYNKYGSVKVRNVYFWNRVLGSQEVRTIGATAWYTVTNEMGLATTFRTKQSAKDVLLYSPMSSGGSVASHSVADFSTGRIVTVKKLDGTILFPNLNSNVNGTRTVSAGWVNAKNEARKIFYDPVDYITNGYIITDITSFEHYVPGNGTWTKELDPKYFPGYTSNVVVIT
jgi:hypothetical protein